MTCEQPGCTGRVVDGYCNVCGMAPRRAAGVSVSAVAPSASAGFPSADNGRSASTPPGTGVAAPETATMRRAGTRRTTGATRGQLGAGLVAVPPTSYRDPSDAVLEAPAVAESRRFCARCGEPVGRSRDGSPGRTEGFCRSCGGPFSFTPKLAGGDVVAGQYEVVGCLAHGGMGWVYLAKDRNVSDRWVVLKGLLNTGDDDAMAAALAERRFLAEVEHPNIVKILNFVQHGTSGYIVMEYVGGKSLKDILSSGRRENGGRPDPLPVAHAIAYILEILPAFAYLHRSGLLFCDFKLDNVIQTQHSLKLIDLGGVYRLGDATSPDYGTVGYQAPEVAEVGPSIPSDLFTVARTLALLCFSFKGYQSNFRHTLPPKDTVPVLARFDSLHRFLLKGTAPDPDDRFQSAEEMADQLFGVLREVVALDEGRTVAAPSSQFTDDFRARPDAPDWRLLPTLRVSTDDAAAGFLATLSATDPGELAEQLTHAPQPTVEVDLRLIRALTDAGQAAQALAHCDALEQRDPWEWRAQWTRGVGLLARGRRTEAMRSFEHVLSAVPGELAPKLALAVAHESGSAYAEALPWYELVGRTDPSFTTAAFGLARCRLAAGDRAGALAAYEAVPASSSSYDDAQLARIECLIATDAGHKPRLDELQTAASAIDKAALVPAVHARLTVELLLAALRLLADPGGAAPDPSVRLLGVAFTEDDVRAGVERGYRTLAHLEDDRAERTRLVDHANAVRPRTWT
jgi:serine/threonine-protein kinase PknG